MKKVPRKRKIIARKTTNRKPTKRKTTKRLLGFDPTPTSYASGRSLRRAHSSEYRRIRKRHIKGVGPNCEVCKTGKGKDTHEVYEFPKPGVIRLTRLVLVCQLCHDAIHLERLRGFAGADYIAEVEAHYCKVNKVTRAQLERDFAAMKRRTLVIQRSNTGLPTMDFGPYQAQVDEWLKNKRPASDYFGDNDWDSEPFPDDEEGFAHPFRFVISESPKTKESDPAITRVEIDRAALADAVFDVFADGRPMGYCDGLYHLKGMITNLRVAGFKNITLKVVSD